MQRWRKFVSLPAGERGLFLRAAVRLFIVGTAVRLLPYRALWPLIRPGERLPPSGTPLAYLPSDITLAIDRAGSVLPFATCLPRAIVGRDLLASCGYAASVEIGVLRSDHDMEAHAWVETESGVIVGATSDNRSFTLLRTSPTAK